MSFHCHAGGRGRVRRALSLLLVLLATTSARASRSDGFVVDELRFRNAQGAELRLGDLRGRVVVIYTFTSTEPSAGEALVHLSRLDAESDCRLVVLALSLDPDPQDLARLLQSVRPRIAMLLDGSGRLGAVLGVGRAPVALVLDRGGEIRERHELRGETDFGRLEEAVTELLDE